MKTIEKAKKLCQTIHREQFDENGQVYFDYLETIAQACFFDEMKIVVYLQDVTANSAGSASLNEIRLTFGNEIGDAVDAMTRRMSEAYSAYLLRLKENPLAFGVMLKNTWHKMQTLVIEYSNELSTAQNHDIDAPEILLA
ncbi:MAG: hypothetical protein GX781_01235 [Clostridiales bacterium]|nr:hypothetical protein [Clostridiales bacterium]